MIHESNLGGWSVASPSDIERTARDLMRFRERFFTGPDWDGRLVRPLILRSWERCRAMHVDATRLSAPLAVTRDAQLREVREASEPLMRAAREVIDRLSDQLVDSGYVIVLTNASGCILNVVGDRAIVRRLARIDFVAGGDWSEAAAGTNAIGTALSDRRSVQLLAAEHFCEGWTDLTCTAVPIRDPRSGEVIGVLDITGDYRLIRVHLTNLLAISVLEIEERLRRLHDTERGLAHALAGLQPVWDSAPPPGGVNKTPEPKAAREFVDDNVLLTFASGAIGASLDLTATIRTVAEQTEALLKAQGTAVVLFPSERESQYHVWSQAAGQPDEVLAAALERCDAPAVLQERGEPIIADDIAAAPIFGESGAFEPFRSIALLPLPTARGTIGFVAAARRTATPWGFGDLRRAFALMSGAATAIDNALLFESLRQHNRHIEAINTIAQLLGELLEPAEHLEEIIHKIVDTLDYDGGALCLRSGDGGALVRAATYGDFPARASGANGSNGGSYFAAALCVGKNDLGVLKLYGGEGSLPTSSDRATITAIAQQVAMALKNAQLLQTAREVDVLRRADRLKSEFLATVSHDLRSPLTAICAGIDGMRDHPGGATADDGLLQTIWNQADRLGRLVDQLLDISQIERGGLRLDCEWHDLRSLLEDTCEGLAPLYGRDRIVIDVASPSPLLFVDRDRFIQMLYNLIDNACKYSPSHKPVTLEATWTADQITLGIVDGGPGILEREREHIFKRFYRGESAGGTTHSIGLGLAICRGIVEAHGGTIWLEEPQAVGSIFRVRIPLRTDFGWDIQ